MRYPTLLLLSALALGALLLAQTSTPGGYLLPIWDTSAAHYIWPKLGTTLAVTNGALDVASPPAATRHYDVALTLTGSSYPLPTGAKNVAVMVNGLRNRPGTDYTITSGAVAPISPWPPDASVTCDYDQ